MNRSPTVSIICLCHNQKPYVAEAIESALKQNYDSIELIVIDDGSTDGSKQEIKRCLDGLAIKFISIDESVGNCKAFNQGLAQATGSFVIDLAADDVLHPDRVALGIAAFDSEKVGVNYCDVNLIDENGASLGNQYDRDEKGQLIETVPEGDVYLELITRYFISPPSMMIRKEVMDDLGGYDESLAYEDFDFWIRSSRDWHYSFTNAILVTKRMLPSSHGAKQFKYKSPQQASTLQVCKKIKALNRYPEEALALKKRIWYEISLCLRQGNLSLVPGFLRLL